MIIQNSQSLCASPYRKKLFTFVRRFAPNGMVRCTAAYALSLAIGGCAVVDPYVKMPAPTSASISFSEARNVARQRAEDFNTKLEELEQFDLATGTLLVGAGIAALAFGIYDAHEDALLGAALVGGTAVAGRSFLPIQARKEIYQSGTSAIGCAIASVGLGEPDSAGTGGGTPPAPARFGIGAAASGPLSRAAARLETLSGAGSPGRNSPVGFAPGGGAPVPGAPAPTARALLNTASNERDAVARFSGVMAGTRIAVLDSRFADAQDSAGDLSAALKQAVATRGERLWMATEAIVSAVNAKLVAARITPEDSLKAALGNFTKTHGDIKSIAKSLVEKADDAEEKGEDAKEAIMAATATSANTPMATMATTMQADVEDKEKKAKEMKNTAAYVLSLVEASDTCLNGLK